MHTPASRSTLHCDSEHCGQDATHEVLAFCSLRDMFQLACCEQHKGDALLMASTMCEQHGTTLERLDVRKLQPDGIASALRLLAS